MSMRWHDDSYEADALAWWQVVGILLLVTGTGPIVLVQLAWWLVTGDRLGA